MLNYIDCNNTYDYKESLENDPNVKNGIIYFSLTKKLYSHYVEPTAVQEIVSKIVKSTVILRLLQVEVLYKMASASTESLQYFVKIKIDGKEFQTKTRTLKCGETTANYGDEFRFQVHCSEEVIRKSQNIEFEFIQTYIE